MHTEKIILNKFNYLIDKYKFSYSHFFERGDYYIFSNSFGKIEIYLWEQFNEVNISIIRDKECITIDPFLERPKAISKINSRKKGIKGFFYDSIEDYWEIISNIIKESINSTNTIFGLKI